MFGKWLWIVAIVAWLAIPAVSFAAATPSVVLIETYSSGTRDTGSGIAVDASGNVYITGTTQIRNSVEFRTIKYDSSGNIIWNVTYTNIGDDYAYGIAVDSSGNVYVVGVSYVAISSSMDEPAFRTIKYNSSGSIVWNVTYSTCSCIGGVDYAYAVAVDSSGNVYVTGGTQPYTSSQMNEFRTIKYNSSGSVVWNITSSSSGAADAIALDSSGNVYVAGSGGVVKYNSSGSTVWTVYNSNDAYTAITVDSSGNVYVTGKSYTGSVWNQNVIKYNSTGSVVWDYNGLSTNYITRGIALDSSGDVYVTGIDQSSSTMPLRTIEYNNSGSVLWNVTYSGSSDKYDWGEGITLDASGNIYIGGYIQQSNLIPQFLILKYRLGCSGPFSFTYTNAITAGVTPIRAVDFTELRMDINSLRTDAGLSSYSWTNSTLSAGSSPIRAADLTDLRTALAAVYAACGQSAPIYTDGTITAGSSPIRAIDITQLRSAVSAAP
jgi:hypothetical protein